MSFYEHDMTGQRDPSKNSGRGSRKVESGKPADIEADK